MAWCFRSDSNSAMHRLQIMASPPTSECEGEDAFLLHISNLKENKLNCEVSYSLGRPL